MLKFEKSSRKRKKYSVMYNGRKIHFGDKLFTQFKDTTGLGIYSHLDNLDKKRRKNYLSRAMGIKDKNGKLTYKDKSSPNYYSIKYLWSG